MIYTAGQLVMNLDNTITAACNGDYTYFTRVHDSVMVTDLLYRVKVSPSFSFSLSPMNPQSDEHAS